MSNLLFLPHYVFLTGSLLKERDTLPIYLFTGLVIDRIFYHLPFINTIIFLFFFIFSLYFKNIKGRKSGQYKDIELTLLFNPDMKISCAHSICDQIESEIKKELGNVSTIIHAEPA